jgi:hypothetical protein
MTHLNYETLLDYLENRLSAEEQNAVEAHLAESCPQCNRRLTRLRAVLDATEGDRTVAPPADALKRAIETARSRKRTTQPGPWTRIVAALSFDNRLQLSAAATRGAARVRQMLFTAEQMDIDLQIKPVGADHDLLGQVLGTGRSGEELPAFVRLQSSEGELLRATETDSLGQFAFREVPSGIYDLVFDFENQEVAVTGLDFEND